MEVFYLFIYLFIYLFTYLFIYFWLCWVSVSVRGLSPVAASGGHSSSWCAGLSLSRPLPLRSTGSRRAGSVVRVEVLFITFFSPFCSQNDFKCSSFLSAGSLIGKYEKTGLPILNLRKTKECLRKPQMWGTKKLVSFVLNC